MLTPIKIERVDDTVTFETVSINKTDNVFFKNLDGDPDPEKSIHWPVICNDKIDPSTSPPNSSQCIVPLPDDLLPPNNVVTYGCQMPGHETEQGIINVFAVLASTAESPSDIVKLEPAIQGKPITGQQVVQGGMSPYEIIDPFYKVTDNNTVVDSGPGIGPGLQLNADQTNSVGIAVTGKPTRFGTYSFTFTVSDGMRGNLEVECSMVVSSDKRVMKGSATPLKVPQPVQPVQPAPPPSRKGPGPLVVGGAAATAALAVLCMQFFPSGPNKTTDENLTSPPAVARAFANPPELPYRPSEKRLRGVMQLSGGLYLIPNVGAGNLRQFRGWDAASPTPTPPPSDSALPVSPGPTLRARLGDVVEISFLNQIDDSLFPKTVVKEGEPGVSDVGCDEAGKRDAEGRMLPYPGLDKLPNCFHASTTANIHFHGTHTSPDGLGDNVLVQVLAQTNQPDWTATFNKLFDSGKIPQQWTDMPADYQTKQLEMIKAIDPALYEADQKRITAGQWPQYLVGAFPNFFAIPDFDKVGAAFNSGGNDFKAGQAPGTHWYHAHKHGSTSLHILNGLAGAFVIESSREGGYDHVIRKFYGWGNSYKDHEKILVFQQYDTIQNLERQGRQNENQGKGIKQILVNGKLTPTISMKPGEVQLWRLVNATEGNREGIIYPELFQTEGFRFKQTAQDGVQLSPANYDAQPYLDAAMPNHKDAIPNFLGPQHPGLALAAGNRADLLVQAPTSPSAAAIAFTSNGKVLFFVKVSGPPMTLPNGAFPTKDKWAAMPKFLNDLRKPAPPKDIENPKSTLQFQWEEGRTRAGREPEPGRDPENSPRFPPRFMISGKQFDGLEVDQCMPLDGLQDWILENHTTVAHPFHIHINPFQVVKIETPVRSDDPNVPTYIVYEPTKDFIWQDVIGIPPAVFNDDGSIAPGRITIRQTYLDFFGTYVLHCHILAHEDRGMMQLVRVVEANKYDAGCKDNIPEHH